MSTSSPGINQSDDAVTERSGKRNFLEVSFSEFIQLLLKKWWLFALIGAVAGTAGYLKARMEKIEYESQLTFVIDEEGSEGGISGALGLAAQFGLNLGSSGNIFSGDNILEIMKSRRLVEKVLLSSDTFNKKPYSLIEYFLHHSGWKMKKGQEVHFKNGQPRETFSYAQDSVLYSVYNDFIDFYITAERIDKRLHIFSLRVKSFDEKFSKVFTDKLISTADSFYSEISSKKTRETLEILEQRVALMKGNLNSSISNRASSEDANLNPAFAEAYVPQQKQQANIQVYAGAYGEMFKNLELARFQYLKKIPLVQIIDHANYPMKKIKPGKLRTALLFALGAVFAVAFLMWLVRIFRVYR